MQIEFLEAYRHDGEEYAKGDRKTLPDNVAAVIVDAGLAKDVAGVVKTGERDISTVRLVPASVKHGQTAENG